MARATSFPFSPLGSRRLTSCSESNAADTGPQFANPFLDTATTVVTPIQPESQPVSSVSGVAEETPDFAVPSVPISSLVPRRLRFSGPPNVAETGQQFVRILPTLEAVPGNANDEARSETETKPDFIHTVMWMREMLYQKAGLSMDNSSEPPEGKQYNSIKEEWKQAIRNKYGTRQVSDFVLN